MLVKVFKSLISKDLIKYPKYFSNVYVSHRETNENNDSVPFEFTNENYKEIETLLAKYPSNYKRSAVIPVLFIAQKQNNNFLSLQAMKKTSKLLEMSEMDVFEVASFYTMFNREKVGKFHLQICGTTPCQLCGSREITKAIEDHLGTKLGHTSKDGLFTLQEVECLGACTNAPMLQINNEWVYEDLTPKNVVELLDNLKNGKPVKKGPQTNRRNAEGPKGKTTLKDFDHNKDHIIDRDFAQAKKTWSDAKELERLEAEKKKAAAAAAAAQQKK